MRFNAAQSIKNLLKPANLTKGKSYKQLILFVGIYIYLIKGKAFKDINTPKIEESHQTDPKSNGKSLAK